MASWTAACFGGLDLPDLDYLVYFTMQSHAYLNVLQWSSSAHLLVDWIKLVEVSKSKSPLELLGMRYDFIYELEAGSWQGLSLMSYGSTVQSLATFCC